MKQRNLEHKQGKKNLISRFLSLFLFFDKKSKVFKKEIERDIDVIHENSHGFSHRVIKEKEETDKQFEKEIEDIRKEKDKKLDDLRSKYKC